MVKQVFYLHLTMCSKSGALPPGVPFWVDFWAQFLIIFEAQHDPQNEPKMSKMKPETLPNKQHIPRHEMYVIFLNLWPCIFWKSMNFSIRSTNFTYLGFSRSVVASPEKRHKSAQTYTPKHTKIQQNPLSKKQWILSSILAWFGPQKWWPPNPPKWHPWAPKGPLGAPWGSHGAHQMLQDRVWAPIWHPKWP